MRGNLGIAAAGRLGLVSDLLLKIHLASCPGCRQELAELQSLVRELGLTDPGRAANLLQGPVSPASTTPEPGPMAVGKPAQRFRWALGGLALAAAVAGGSLIWLHQAPTPQSISLHGGGGVQATATLTAEAWGTDLSLQVAGQPAGRVYRVSMESKSGSWWEAGSYQSQKAEMVVHLACGVSASKVDRIWVENASGRVVLRAYL